MRIRAILIGGALATLLALPAQAGLTTCRITFNLSGWSLVYKQMKGQGRVTCENGQSADVALESHGAGLTIGKSDVLNGHGTFSEVEDISEVYGSYAQADASARATKGGEARVMTKGEISLAISGEGRGWDVGVSLGSFTIKRR